MPTTYKYKGKVLVGTNFQVVTVEAVNGREAMKLLKMQYGDNARTMNNSRNGDLTRA